MANLDQVFILKQGVRVWNSWREQHPEEIPDLTYAELGELDVQKRGFELDDANLSNADLSHAELFNAEMRRADLSGADLNGASLWESALWDANLRNADLSQANLRGANLPRADLSYADLSMTVLEEADVSGARFFFTQVGYTIFGNIDLRKALDLEWVHHIAPSYISTSTLEASEGHIPEIFLRGAGLSDTFICH